MFLKASKYFCFNTFRYIIRTTVEAVADLISLPIFYIILIMSFDTLVVNVLSSD